MNYLLIIQKGWNDENTRNHLSAYFVREYKKAEGYSIEEFFDGLLLEVMKYEKKIEDALIRYGEEATSAIAYNRKKLEVETDSKVRAEYEDRISLWKEQLANNGREWKYRTMSFSDTNGHKLMDGFEVQQLKGLIEKARDSLIKKNGKEEGFIFKKGDAGVTAIRIAILYHFKGVEFNFKSNQEIASRHGYSPGINFGNKLNEPPYKFLKTQDDFYLFNRISFSKRNNFLNNLKWVNKHIEAEHKLKVKEVIDLINDKKNN